MSRIAPAVAPAVGQNTTTSSSTKSCASQQTVVSSDWSGTAYRVAVAAINVIGTGTSSDAGEAVASRRDDRDAAPVVDDLPLQAVSVPGTGAHGRRPVARTPVPGLGGRIA